MTPFEYVIVLISIILGLGITFVLSGIVELIRRWNSVQHFWPYLIWIALVFVLHIQEWWATYELRTVTTWSLPLFLFVITYPILLFVLANLLFPAHWPDKGLDMKEFYFSNCNKFFMCVLFFALLSVMQNVIITGYQLRDQIIQFIVFALFTVMLLRPTRNISIHSALAVFMLVTMIVGLYLTKDLAEVSR